MRKIMKHTDEDGGSQQCGRAFQCSGGGLERRDDRGCRQCPDDAGGQNRQHPIEPRKSPGLRKR